MKTSFADALAGSRHSCVGTLRRTMLAGVSLLLVPVDGALAQTHTVVPDGVVQPKITMTADGDALTVEQGGIVFEAADNAVEVSGAGVAVSIVNDGLIQGDPVAIRALPGSSIDSLSNSGTIIAGDFAVQIDGGDLGNLSNTDLILGAGGDGIFVSNGNIVNMFNHVTGGIGGQHNAIQVANGSILGLHNAGVIEGLDDNGVLVTGGGISDLVNSGTITGETSGIDAGYIDGLTNLGGGEISSQGIGGIGINVTGTGGFLHLHNAQGATISGDASGIDAGNTFIGFATNAGTIQGGSAGVITADNIFAFVNTGTGQIEGGAIGIQSDGTVSGLVNSGRIVGFTSYGLSVLGGSLLGSENHQGGTIFGGNDGLFLDSGNLRSFVNAGIIAGSTDAGILVDGGNLIDFTNSEVGQIRGGVDGIRVDLAGAFPAEVSNVVNAGSIEGNAHAGIFVSNGVVTHFSNLSSGIIAGQETGIQVLGGGIEHMHNAGTIEARNATGALNGGVAASQYLGNFTNSGTVRANGSSVSDIYGVYSTRIENMFNSGVIQAQNANGGAIAVGADQHLTSLTNAGRIFTDISANDWAIHESVLLAGENTDLTLLPGSVIQGHINIEGGAGAGMNRLFVGPGLNLATTFDFDLPDAIETYGVLWTADPASGLVSVADTSVFAAEDNANSDIMRGISSVLARQLGSERAGPGRNWWVDGFGGIGTVNGAGASIDVHGAHAGLVTGFDTELGNGMRGGLFGGLSAGSLASGVENGATLGTKNFFLGGYGRYAAGRWYAAFNLTGGIGTNSFERLVANNLVFGGLETSHGGYMSWSLSPEITVGMNEGFTSRDIRPSATVRYGFLHSAGFAETGLTAGELSAGVRARHILDLRLQAAMPVEVGDRETKIEARAGLDGRLTMGGSFDAALGGIAVGDFSPGGEEFGAGAFVGADLSRALGGNRSFFASTELGFGSDTAFRADVRAGVRGVF